MANDLISRQAAIDAIKPTLKSILQGNSFKAINVVDKIRALPSAEPEIIRCKDCRWWDKYGNYDNGYCMAAKHGYLSEHWEIRISRTYKGDFYCADAEPKGEQEWKG